MISKSAIFGITGFLAATTLANVVLAETPLTQDAITALHAQADHFASVARRGKQQFYTKQFDLSGIPHYQPHELLTGWIKINGDNYLADGQLSELWRAEFAKFQPGVHLAFYLPTSATAFGGLYSDTSDIAFSHEPGFYDLLAYERVKNTEPLQLNAVTGSYDVSGWSNSFALMVNDANPLKKITIEELDGVFGAERDGGWLGTNWHTDWARGRDKNIRTWGQLGLKGEWADKPIVPYGFTLRYNTATLFSDKVMQGGDKWNETIHTFANYVKPDGTRYIEADQIMDRITKDKYGIAYVLFRGDKPNEHRLAVAPRGTTNYIEHSLDNVQNRTYPLIGNIFMFLNTRPGIPIDPKLKEFVRYILSYEGQMQVEKDGKYLPLTAEVVAEDLKKLEAWSPSP